MQTFASSTSSSSSSSSPASFPVMSTAAPRSPQSEAQLQVSHQYLPVLITLVLLIFFFIGFFSIYFFRCVSEYINGTSGVFRRNNSNANAAGNRNTTTRGLDPIIASSFPTFVYSKVKDLREEKDWTLECAVCLSEFQDDDELKLITGCDHAFHPECINLWFEAHTTCPVCRRDLEPPESSSPEVVIVTIVSENDNEGGEGVREEHESGHGVREDHGIGVGGDENRINGHDNIVINHDRLHEVERTGFGRSYSTGYSMRQRDERFTLRLPQHMHTVRRHNSAASCIPFGDYTGEHSGVSHKDNHIV
ncbi:hypothetical protein Scep_026974 [Stephania cephalantha]|uniref:RING-type E3 ubiquitin transferase n=1 Tax=Stephania cephalantha TaxID=152367 RepID=A0AAP0HTS0_9MAGN